MSKVVRLNDQVLKDLEKVSEFMKSNYLQDNDIQWHMVFDDADENYYIKYVLQYFMAKNLIV